MKCGVNKVFEACVVGYTWAIIFGSEMRGCEGRAKQCVLRWFGHVKGMDKYRFVERIM